MPIILFIILMLLPITGFSERKPSDYITHSNTTSTLLFTQQTFANFFKSTKHIDIFKNWEAQINDKIKQAKYVEALHICKNMEKAALASKSEYWLYASYYYSGICTKYLDDYKTALTLFFKITENKKNPLSHDVKKMFQLYRHIGGAYKNLNEYNKSLLYYKKSLQLDNEAKDTCTLISIYISMGIMYSSQQHYREANDCYMKGLNLIKESDDKMSSIVYNNLGNDNYAQGNFTDAIKFYIQSIQLSEKTNDLDILAFSYNNLGNIYAGGLNDFNKAYEYYSKSLEIEQENKNNEGIAQELNNIGYVQKRKLNYAEAKKMHTEALAIFKTLKNAEGTANTLENLGDLYSKIGNYDKAISSFNQCIEYRKNNDDKNELASIYNNVAALYYIQKEYQKALSYYLQALELAKKGNDKPLMKGIYSGIHETYAKLGKFNKAYEYAQRYSDLNDTLLNETVSKQVIDIQEKYEKNKMEQKVALQNMEIKNNLLQRNGILAALLLSILVSAGVVYFVIQKRKNEKLLYNRNAQLKDTEIKSLIQNSEIRSMVSMAEGQEKERQRISRELHDRVGSMLSLVKLNLSTSNDENNPVIKENVALLDQTYQEVRNISHNLYSGLLSTFGLKVALLDLKKTVEAHNALRFNVFFHDEEVRLPKENEEVVYRIMQELITNALKHAEAKNIDIQINSEEEGAILISVEDDGKGFNTQLKNNEGIGLANIRYRLASIGGSIDINSSPGNGACFMLTIPVAKNENNVGL